MIRLIRRIFRPYKLSDIFTPNKSAELSYIYRETIEDDFNRYMEVSGKPIIIYGHSGSGKTTLTRKVLSKRKCNYIKIHCERNTKHVDIILQAFDQLNAFYTKEIRNTRTTSISSALSAEYNEISSKLQCSIKQEQSSLGERIIPPQLTSQKLAHFLAKVNCILVIEDFHKVDPNEKTKIADTVKVFIDETSKVNDVRVICIGAVGTARELVEFDNNLSSRVAEISVPLLSDDEIKRIINKGCTLLNIKMSKELIDNIVYYSNNIGALAHQMCFDICYASKITKSKIIKEEINNNCLISAVESFVKSNSDTFTKVYDSIILLKPYAWNVLKTFDTLEKESLSIDEIESALPKENLDNTEEVHNFLLILGTLDYNSLIRYDVNSQRYSISTPFFRAFLKMKFELERLETEKVKQKKEARKKHRHNLKPRSEFRYEDDFMFKYLDILNKINEAQRDLIEIKIKQKYK